MSTDVLTIVINFLKTDLLEFALHSQDVELMQRLLWLSDFFEIDGFDQLLIETKIIPLIDSENCLVLLLEALKKIKTAHESANCWYDLLEKCIECASQHLAEIQSCKREDLLKIDQDVLEEIIIRAVTISRSYDFVAQDNFVRILLENPEEKNIFEFLNFQRNAIHTKKIMGNFT